MKLPTDTIIPPEKIVNYLLVQQPRGDKSAFLAKAGYGDATARNLLEDLRTQLLPLEARFVEEKAFGRYYEIRGTLRGPNGVALKVRTI